MGLDIYAGTFVRYYAENWKTKMQQFAEENGLKYTLSRKNPVEPEDKASVEEIIDAVHFWQKRMGEVLKELDIHSFEPWEENNEKEYYTDKPDWDAFYALLLMVSAKVLGKECPAKYEKQMDVHPYILEAAEEKIENSSLFSGVFHFIPQNDYYMFQWYLANRKEAVIATTANLQAELESINELLWNADENTILQWTQTEGYPTDAALKDGKLKWNQEHEMYDTESLAKYSYAILYRAVQFAVRNNVPVIFDY